MLLFTDNGLDDESLIFCALFAIIPLTWNPVAWIAERKSVLAMLFFLLTLCLYGWYARKPSVGRYMVVAISFAMALMSKPMAITLPFALLLLDYWPLQRVSITALDDLEFNPSNDYSRLPIWRLCLEKVPLLAMSLGSAIVTVAAQRSGGAVTHNLVSAPWLRLENAIVSYASYLAKAVWPSRLAILYPYPHSLPLWKVLLSALLLITVTALVVKYREHRYLPVGWFWYVGTMIPMIGLMQVGNQAMADRYAYLPLLGIFVMAVWGVADLAAPKAVGPRASFRASVGSAAGFPSIPSCDRRMHCHSPGGGHPHSNFLLEQRPHSVDAHAFGYAAQLRR